MTLDPLLGNFDLVDNSLQQFGLAVKPAGFNFWQQLLLLDSYHMPEKRVYIRIKHDSLLITNNLITIP